MAVTTTGTAPKLLWPGLHKIFGLEYDEIPLQYTKVFESLSPDGQGKAYEEFLELTGFGLAPAIPEAQGVSYDTTGQGYTTRATHVNYGLGFIESEQSVDDNQYKGRSTNKTKALARTMRSTKETVSANVFIRGFDSGYVGGDGKEMIATDHPTVNGTQSNELSTPADLSQAAIEDAVIQIMNMTDSRGLRIAATGKQLIVPSNLWAEAERIVKSTHEVDNANNAINPINNYFSEGVFVWRYLTDTDAWFIKTDVKGAAMFNRKELRFQKDGDFDTDNFKHKATERYSVFWYDWRWIFGSAGA